MDSFFFAGSATFMGCGADEAGVAVDFGSGTESWIDSPWSVASATFPPGAASDFPPNSNEIDRIVRKKVHGLLVA